MKTNIGDWVPSIQSEAADLYQVMTGIAVVLVIASLTVKAYQAIQGNVSEIWQALVSTVIVGILISTLPTIFNEIQFAFHDLAKKTDSNPSDVFSKFHRLLASSAGKDSKDFTAWDVLTSPGGGIARLILYGFVSLLAYFALGLQWVVILIQQFLMIFGVAMSPIFLGFAMLRSLQPNAVKYFLALTSVAIWPLGFLITAKITNLLLAAAADDGIYTKLPSGSYLAGAGSLFFIIVLTIWTFAGTIGAPLLISKVFKDGANAGAEILSSFGMTFGNAATQGIGAGFTATLSGASTVGTIGASLAGMTSGAVNGALGRSGLLAPTVIGLAASSLSGGRTLQDYKEQASDIERKLRS